MTDEAPEVDPLFVGLPRPPLVMGVPVAWFGVNFIVFGIGLIGFASLTGKFFFVLLINIPVHIAGYMLTRRDAHFMSVLVTFFEKCGPTRNNGFWKSNSYSP